MKRVYISLGSNVDAENHIQAAIDLLRQQFGDIEVSTTYQNPSVGFDGDDFLNLVVGLDSDLSVQELASAMRDIEASLGRDRSMPKFSSRTIDLDLLIIGNKIIREGGILLPRDEILKYAFVLCPLAELVGDLIHPETLVTYQTLWQEFDQKSQPMTALEITCQK